MCEVGFTDRNETLIFLFQLFFLCLDCSVLSIYSKYLLLLIEILFTEGLKNKFWNKYLCFMLLDMQLLCSFLIFIFIFFIIIIILCFFFCW